MTTFSIIIPIYKVEKYVSQCIESVLNQTFSDFEVLCVDDCGEDNSIKIVEEYAKKDSRIKILYHDKNKGVGAARNTALDVAQGEYFFCLDSDDWISSNTIEVLYKTFQECTTESIWFDGYRYYEDSKTFQNVPIVCVNPGYIDITPENLAAFPDMCGMKAYRTESVRRYNLHWPEDITVDEDGHFYFKYYTYYKRVFAINDCLYNYRIRKGSAITNFMAGAGKAKDLYKVITETKDFYIKRGIFDEYKISLIKLAQNRIEMVKNTCFTPENIKITKDFIDCLGFPENFDRLNPNKKPLVSVVVPIYNVEPYVEQCLRSIMYQTYENLEIICVDDCGQDNSMDIVKTLVKEDSRIKIVRHKKNKGLGGARNTGLKKASGEYMLFIDSDDWIEKDCVEEVVNVMNKTGVDSAWFKAQFWLENEQKTAPMDFCSYFMNLNEGYININENNLSSFPLITWNKAYRRDFLLKHKLGWRENVIYEDVEFYYKAFTKTSYIYLIDKYFYYYRQRPGSIMQSSLYNDEKSKTAYFVVGEVYKYLIKENLFEKYQNAYYKYACEILNSFGASNEEKLEFLNLILE